MRENDAILWVGQSFREGGMELELEGRVLTGVRKLFSNRRGVGEVCEQKAVTFLAIPWGRLLPLPHGSAPPLAKSVAEFWGRRWNVWMSDWFRQIIFPPLRTCPVLALFLVFLASGVLHESVINVPLYIVTGRKCFGFMILYFLLQALGILIERRTRNRGMRIFLVWLFVFGAAPLIVNEGLLRILHLWPE